MQNMLILKDLVKKYNNFCAVDHVSLELKKGEFLTLLGPSGSGKTTTLKMVAGLEIPNEGSILVNDKDITTLPPNKRGLGMVFQNYALFPHMTIKQNIAFPLKMKGKVSKQAIDEKVSEILELVQLKGFEERYPSQLSGGQQQRVALARALVFQPPIVLMDEPLGALDKKLRTDMQLEIKRIQNKLNITTIYVTHDQEEALTMSDRIAIMNDGKITQIGTPRDIYQNPVSTFVADFIGESNFLPVDVVERENTEVTLKIQSEIGSTIKHVMDSSITIKEGCKLVIRPEKISLDRNNAKEKISGVISDVIYLGEMIRYIILIDDKFEFIAKQQTIELKEMFEVGESVSLFWEDENASLL